MVGSVWSENRLTDLLKPKTRKFKSASNFINLYIFRTASISETQWSSHFGPRTRKNQLTDRLKPKTGKFQSASNLINHGRDGLDPKPVNRLVKVQKPVNEYCE